MKKHFLILLPFLLCSCINASGNTSSKETLIDTRWYFGTGMSLTLTGSNKKVLEHVFEIFEDYSDLSDAYNSRVDENLKPIVNLACINLDSNEGKEIVVDERLADMLEFGLVMQKKNIIILILLLGILRLSGKIFLRQKTLLFPRIPSFKSFLKKERNLPTKCMGTS